MLTRILPFLGWFKGYRPASFRADLVAGVTVALVLIPQSMAYAQLAGLPPYYGLYAAFLPPMIAALFGSSRQLATGPVAVVSLMTAATLEPLATAGSDAYIAYAIVLATVVGLFQLALGVLRLGIIVNFLSHPVVNGFTNAAAIIIATSQLSKLFGVYVDKAEHHYETVYRVVKAAFHYTHWPTLGLAALAFALMYGLKRINPRIPFVLVAVAVTALISWATGFEHNRKVPISAVDSTKVQETIREYNAAVEGVRTASEERTEINKRIAELEQKHHGRSRELIKLSYRLDLINLEIERQKSRSQMLRQELRARGFRAVHHKDTITLFPEGELPRGAEPDGRHWRIKVGNQQLDPQALTFMGGGAVVGKVPRGLPSLALPDLDLQAILRFLAAAAIISLLGFMEAISIAKAMAAKTRQRLDPNQELIGQGLANILGSFGQSYPVSGSFSRSAVNLGAGAVSGLSSVITSLVVVTTLLLFTPLLYNIPQSVLAAVIMMAVVGLINVKGFVHAYRAQRYDGIIAVVSFVATLGFAPHLDRGIMLGVVLSIGHYLYRNSRPRLASLSMHPDRSLRDADRHWLKECKHIAVIRFEGPLFFANTSYLEDQINEHMQQMPELRHILLPANGINEIDASGEEALSLLIDQVRERGVDISMSGVNENVLDLMRRTHLVEKMGEDHIFPTMLLAVRAIHGPAHEGSDEKTCPLLNVVYRAPDAFDVGKPALPGVQVLIVGTGAAESRATVKRLRRQGLEAQACDGAEGILDEVAKAQPEVLVVDGAAPVASQGNLVTEVLGRWPDIRIVMLTPDEQPDSPDQGDGGAEEPLGVFGYLPRSCSTQELIKIINQAAYDARTQSSDRQGHRDRVA